MSERIRYHLDENVDPDVARALRQYGIEVTTAPSAALLSRSDRDHLAFARSEARVLVTHDADFLRIASSGVEHAGIAYCSKRHGQTGHMVRSLVLIYEVLTPAEMAGRIEFL